MGHKEYTLLTGATGLLGQFLLVELLRSRVPVAVLARPRRAQSARQRVDELLLRFERQSGRHLPRPVVLSGDLTTPQLGLSKREFAWLSQCCQSVIHSGANLSFKPADQHPEREPFTTNVAGTRGLLEICQRHGIGEFHYISSAYVCGLRTGKILEADQALGQKFSNDYENSKLQAELMLRSADDLNLTVYRPSIVIDTAPDSQQLGDRTIYYAFTVYQMLAQQFGLHAPGEWSKMLGLTGHERKNIVPADWVAATTIEIFRRPELHSRTYHLTNPQGTPVIDLEQGFGEAVDIAEQGRRKRPAALPAVIENNATVDQFVATFTPYLRDDPVFDQANLRHALSTCGIANCPSVGAAAIAQLAVKQLNARPGTQTEGGAAAATHWLRRLDALGTFRQNSAESTRGEVSLGLMITGPGGGDWTVVVDGEESVRVSEGGAHAAMATVYTSSNVWDEILQQRTTAHKAAREGVLLLEWNNTVFDASAWFQTVDRVSALLGCASRIRKTPPEVGLHAE